MQSSFSSCTQLQKIHKTRNLVGLLTDFLDLKVYVLWLLLSLPVCVLTYLLKKRLKIYFLHGVLIKQDVHVFISAVGFEPPQLSVSEERHLAILTELPFVVPFEERVKVSHRYMKLEHKPKSWIIIKHSNLLFLVSVLWIYLFKWFLECLKKPRISSSLQTDTMFRRLF